MKKKLTKKIAILLLLLFFSCVIFTSLTYAQTINPETGLPEDINKIAETSKKLTDKEIREQYLKKEWGVIFRTSPFFKPFADFYDKISPFTNPFLNIQLA